MKRTYKLIIQIPCFNEEDSLPITLKELPREIEGIEKVEWLIIDDGSTDKTAEVARKFGVDHIVSFPSNRGLAKGFIAGLHEALHQGADIIVNTDADNQYCADDIPKLIAPILAGQAEIVIGTRPIMNTEHWSVLKKMLQKLGSWVVRIVSNTQVQDAPSGFRAMSRKAASQLHVFNEYTYTLETIIQAGHKGLAVCSVPIRTNGDLRPSRLFGSISAYVKRSVFTIARIFVLYRPFRFFAAIGSTIFLFGFAIGLRFLYLFYILKNSGHTQSLILASLLMTIGFVTGVMGVLADLVAANRKLLEEISDRLWSLEERQKKSHE